MDGILKVIKDLLHGLVYIGTVGITWYGLTQLLKFNPVIFTILVVFLFIIIRDWNDSYF